MKNFVRHVRKKESKINADSALDEMIIADNEFIDNLINQKGREGDTI